MTSDRGLLIGGVLACAIACGGSVQSKEHTQPSSLRLDARAQLEALDREITADMERLAEPRPAAPVAACVEGCATQMSGAAAAATQADASCSPGAGETCTQACTLKDSICENAGKICSIAADLGGSDAYANETCNRGAASCEAAKQRCCSCT